MSNLDNRPYKIIPIQSKSELEDSILVVRQAFSTVAQEMGFTPEDNPTHPSFMQIQHMYELKEKNYSLYGLFEKQQQIGFIAIGPKVNGNINLEKLAVIAEKRHLGYGRALIEFAMEFAAKQGADALSLAMINEHTILKKWYESLGFKEIETKKFPHLTFTVCFMRMELKTQTNSTTL